MRLGQRAILAVEIAAVIMWVALLATGRPTAIDSQTSFEGLSLLEAVESEEAEWLGVYMEGQKIGAALTDRIAVSDGFKFQERSYIKVRAFERDQEITTAFVAHTGRGGALSSFTFYLSAPPVRTDVRGEVVGDELKLAILTGGDVIKKIIPLPDGPPNIALTFKEQALAQVEAVGDVATLSYFDPTTLSQQKMKVTVVETGRATVGGQEVDTFTLEAGYAGFSSRMTVTDDGRTLKEESALGMTMIRESREQALHEGWGDGPPADLIALSIVPVAEPIQNPRDTRLLRARLSGGGVETLLKDIYGNRPVKYLRDVTVDIPLEDSWRPPNLPVVDPEFAPYLEATTTIQSEDETVVRLARSIVGDDLKGDVAARKLGQWVFDEVEKVPTMGVPSAKEVLRTGQGDCNEHTILYTALARAVGLPTRIAAGIVYSDQSYGGVGFFYHAWPEVWLGKWVPVDPTFGQFPADATHIKLIEGDLDQQIALIRVVGKLDIEILEIQ